MKKINICITYLDTIEIEDCEDAETEVCMYVEHNYQNGYNDVEWEEVDVNVRN